MRENYEKISETGVPLLVMVPASLDKVEGYWQRNNIPVIGLADPERETMTLYGQQYNLPKLGWMPATIALDTDHKVAYVHYGKDQRDIATSDEILDVDQRLAG